jgi:epoxyqueuosine reductase
MLNSVAEELYERGLNLQAVFQFNQIPDTLKTRIVQCEPDAARYQYLILLGNGGTRFWESMQRHRTRNLLDENPVDNYFIRSVENTFAANPDYRIIYPGNHLLPLQSLGKLVGWHHDSPLGLGIHPVFGLWFAYRGMILSNTEFIPATDDFDAVPESPCASCQEKHCINACPAAAVTSSGLKIKPCTSYRLESDSRCQTRCISRLVCPIGRDYRYLEEQMAYHYGHSLASIKKYMV